MSKNKSSNPVKAAATVILFLVVISIVVALISNSGIVSETFKNIVSDAANTFQILVVILIAVGLLGFISKTKE